MPKNADGSPKTEFADTDLSASFRENSGPNTLKLVQTISIIAGSALTGVGVGLLVYRAVRTPDNTEIISDVDLEPEDAPGFAITGFGLAPSADGAHFGLTGSF